MKNDDAVLKELQLKIEKLENENRLLKNRLDEAGISYADIYGETDIDEINVYNDNQAGRINEFEVTDKIAGDFFMVFCRGRKDVYALRYTNPKNSNCHGRIIVNSSLYPIKISGVFMKRKPPIQGGLCAS